MYIFWHYKLCCLTGLWHKYMYKLECLTGKNWTFYIYKKKKKKTVCLKYDKYFGYMRFLWIHCIYRGDPTSTPTPRATEYPPYKKWVKVWLISSHGPRSRCYFFFICNVVFHSHSFSSAPKRKLKWEKTF